MLNIIIAVATGVAAAFLVILRENRRLKSDKKLNDIKVQDAKLETKQEAVEQDKKKIKKQLDELEKSEAIDLTSEQIENFWKGRKK